MHIFSIFLSLNFRCVSDIIAVICRNPELVLFFDMYDMLERSETHFIQSKYKRDENAVHSLDRCSVEIQTDTHPIAYSKNTNHIWNLWDLRRMAIQLANLQKCTTHSTQTNCQSSCATQTNLQLP